MRYRDKLVAILRSFAAYDAVRPVNTLTFDNNHAAAYRAMTLLNYYFKLQRAGALPEDLRLGLEAAFAKLGTFLAAPAHFEGGVNHGFNEGAALLLIADNFPAMPGASAWRTTALARLQGMLDSTLDSDGVEVENSPFYHVYVLGLVYQIAQWAKLYEPALAPSYTAAAEKMLRYAAYVTQPSGYLPMLGATATTFVPSQDPTVYGPMASADAEFAFAYSRGARGTAPPDGTYLFPSSGLFLMRSPLGSASNLPNQTFVTFDAGPYRTEHSDLDALGITMYSNGSTVLPESGLFTYTDQPDRSFFHGTRAHNTVVVDGADQAQGAATPGPFGSAAGATWARGTSALYTGVTHRRSVVVLRQGLTLVVDRLAGSATHTYTQTWHLPPDASIEASGQDVAVTNGAGKRILRDPPGRPGRGDSDDGARPDLAGDAGLVLVVLRVEGPGLGAGVLAQGHERELHDAAGGRAVRDADGHGGHLGRERWDALRRVRRWRHRLHGHGADLRHGGDLGDRRRLPGGTRPDQHTRPGARRAPRPRSARPVTRRRDEVRAAARASRRGAGAPLPQRLPDHRLQLLQHDPDRAGADAADDPCARASTRSRPTSTTASCAGRR